MGWWTLYGLCHPIIISPREFLLLYFYAEFDPHRNPAVGGPLIKIYFFYNLIAMYWYGNVDSVCFEYEIMHY